MMDEADVRRVLAHPCTMIGSDSSHQERGKPHPRTCGTFPRVLGHYSRELGVLDLATAVHRMTGLPAGRFGLGGRGLIAAGAAADFAVFAPEETFVVDARSLEHRHPICPYDGRELTGVVRAAYLAGARIDREVPRGRLLTRRMEVAHAA